MSNTRLDLRTRVRTELQDTVVTYLWSDAAVNFALADAFASYSQYFPLIGTTLATSTANQTVFPLSAVVMEVQAVVVDGVEVPRVMDLATLDEPAFRNQVSQTVVQPVTPFGAAATHGQAWYLDQSAGAVGVVFRYGLAVGRAVIVRTGAAHVLPSDDVTNVTIPDADTEMPVLYACDRLVRSAHTDAVKRGAPGKWADGKEDSGYMQRYDRLLRMRRNRVVVTAAQVLQ